MSPSKPSPDVVILDINLPKKCGGEVLQHIRRSRRGYAVPVVVVSTSDSAKDREDVMNRGANCYFRKPSEYDEFLKLGAVIRAVLPDKPQA